MYFLCYISKNCLNNNNKTIKKCNFVFLLQKEEVRIHVIDFMVNFLVLSDEVQNETIINCVYVYLSRK